MSHVLVVDDDAALRAQIERMLRARGYTTETADSGEAAIKLVRVRRPDLVLLDVNMGGIDGLDTLQQLRVEAPGLPIVIMTGAGTIETAITAFKRGALDFMTKPFDKAELFGTVNAILEARPAPPAPAGRMLIGESPQLRQALKLARRYAGPDINVLIEAETGTGKELFARTIHAESTRAKGPFIPVDCSILSENLIESELFGHEKGAFSGATERHIGHFERANTGTAFLDEIGNLKLPYQAKLLRVLQEKTIERVGGKEVIKLDLRVVSATNVDLLEAVRRGTFREDLYYRLCDVKICPPPLRQRDGDVERLARHFVQRWAAQFGFAVRGISDAAIEVLEGHAWPGNVRELENAIKSAVVIADGEIRPEHLPKHITQTQPSPRPRSSPASVASPESAPAGSPGSVRVAIDIDLGSDMKTAGRRAIEAVERTLIEACMGKGYSQRQLADILGIDDKTLRTKLKAYGLRSGAD